MIVSASLVLLSSSWVPARVIVCGVAKTVGSKVMLEIPEESMLAKAMASRRLRSPGPGTRASLVVLTTRLAKAGPAFVRSNEADCARGRRDDDVSADDVVGHGGDGGLPAGDDGRGIQEDRRGAVGRRIRRRT